MLTTYLTALASIIVLMSGWLLVQRLWRRTFTGDGTAPEDGQQDDALAGRGGCHGCRCERAGGTEQPCSPEIMTEVTRHAP